MQTSAPTPTLRKLKLGTPVKLAGSAETGTIVGRADRLHRLWRIATGNFREARFAHDLASKAAMLAQRGSLEQQRANSLIQRSMQSMEHWNRRSAALARAEINTVLGDNNHAGTSNNPRLSVNPAAQR